jgi:hypothetical protein
VDLHFSGARVFKERATTSGDGGIYADLALISQKLMIVQLDADLWD